MQKIKVPAIAIGNGGVSKRIKETINNELKKIGREKMIEHKLAPSSLLFEFKFSGGGSNYFQSFKRFSTSLYKFVAKALPYLESTEKPFFIPASTNDANCIIKLSTSSNELELPSIEKGYLNNDWSYILNSDAQAKRNIVKIQRYVKLLNRRAIREGILLKVTLDHAFKLVGTPVVSPMDNKKTLIRYTLEMTLGVRPSFWSPKLEVFPWVSTSKYPDGTDIKTFDEGIAKISELFNKPKTSLTNNELQFLNPVFAHHSNKTFDPFDPNLWNSYSYQSQLVDYYTGKAFKVKGLGRYVFMERIFYYINDFVKILKTLSRETSYVPKVFNIGNPENSGAF